jgi:hypothetical protein
MQKTKQSSRTLPGGLPRDEFQQMRPDARDTHDPSGAGLTNLPTPWQDISGES